MNYHVFNLQPATCNFERSSHGRIGGQLDGFLSQASTGGEGRTAVVLGLHKSYTPP